MMTSWVISWQIIVCYFSDFLTVWLLLWFLLINSEGGTGENLSHITLLNFRVVLRYCVYFSGKIYNLQMEDCVENTQNEVGTFFQCEKTQKHSNHLDLCSDMHMFP